ncbi:MAG: ShlB/FhaC/HecB family hemolysin secretion/activation protein [Pseudomonadota bacterium]
MGVHLRGYIVWLTALGLALAAPVCLAQTVPGPADAGRVEQRVPDMTPPPALEAPASPMHILPSATAPEASKGVKLTLREVRISGMNAFTTSEVEDIYKPLIGQTITLDKAWQIAGELMERYRSAGYFLSQVFVPAQEVENGIISITVVEGYIGEIALDDPLQERHVVRGWLERLKSYRPLKTDQLEAVLLQLNDLPGVSLRAVLEPIKGAKDGAVKLTLAPQETHGRGRVGFDNNGSRFLGPYEMSAQYEASVLPLQQTSVTVLAGLPVSRLRYGNIHQEIALLPALNMEIYGGNTYANPGYTLKSSEIESDSMLLGVGFNYKLIRQRQENLTARIALESRDTDSDILGTPLTRDKTRVARARLTYGVADGWNGNNLLTTTLSQGIDGLGASKAGQLNLSRAKATPDFSKAEWQLARLQAITSDWNAMLATSGQIASGALYSSEEFSYGGQPFGRAYDDSEITGDRGIAASAELRYMGIPPWKGVALAPYGFYDIGKVWNYDTGQPAHASGSSAGAGVRIDSTYGISSNLAVAFPLTRDVTNPLQGNGKNPRYMMQLSYGF